MLGASYALWTTNAEQKSMNVLNTDCIKLEMEELSGEIKLEKAYPILDKEGEELDPFKFRIKNVCNTGVDYAVNIEVLSESTMEEKNIAVKIDQEDKKLLLPNIKTTKIETNEYSAKEAYKIYTESLNPNESKEHEIRMWMDESAGNDSQNRTFKAKVVISGTSNEIGAYTESILHGADPVLNDTKEEPIAMLTASGETTSADTLVPVTIDESGVVRKADITIEWYKYEEKRWANAVILADNSKAKDLQPGAEIKEDQIESYFVWIPKYRYKIFDMGKYESTSDTLDETKQNKAIEIEFGLEDTKDDATNENYKQCETPGRSGEDGNCDEGYWMTHPAFLAFKDSKGIWVGKFETGYNQSTDDSTTITVDSNWTKDGAQHDENKPSKVIIKPNVYSWRFITIGNAYQTSFEYQRNLDSHMMKNTEWGAVAYLAHSKYGTCIDENCTKVTINRNSNYITGCSNSDIFYTNPSSIASSTTGNYTGIYDMSGGAWEYVMGAMTSATSTSNIYLENIEFNQSGLNVTEIADEKYIDLYTQGTDTRYNRRILGDATGETGPFNLTIYNINSYLEDSYFVNQNNSWFQRGGGNGNASNSGIFAFSHYSGINYETLTFRIVLTP